MRQDMLIAQGLTSPFKKGDESAVELQTMALARLRQLSAHEVGHTLGLSHNFAASQIGRSSVMDYPHPLVEIDKFGEVMLNNAYASGIAQWDKLTIKYAYSEFNEQDEAQGLKNIRKQISDSGIPFITDQDSRAGSMAHPNASLWDNGSDPSEELLRVLKVRRVALNQFGEASIKNDVPWSTLEKILVPVYLFHRFQSDAAAKLIGGLNYEYSHRAEDTENKSVKQLSEVSSARQQRALEVLLKTMSSEELAIPKNILSMIPPPAYGYPRDRENFTGNALPSFDALSAVATAASHTLELLLDPSRAARLIQQKALNPNNIGLAKVQTDIVNSSWKKSTKYPYLAEVQRNINWAVLKQLFSLAVDEEATPQVRAITHLSLRELQSWLKNKRSGSTPQKAMLIQAKKDIEQFLNSDTKELVPSIKPIPPGSPIGTL